MKKGLFEDEDYNRVKDTLEKSHSSPDAFLDMVEKEVKKERKKKAAEEEEE